MYSHAAELLVEIDRVGMDLSCPCRRQADCAKDLLPKLDIHVVVAAFEGCQSEHLTAVAARKD